MAVDVKNLVAAINPGLYCQTGSDGKLRDEVKSIVKSEGYLKAAEQAKLIEADYLDVAYTQIVKGAMGAGKKAKGSPVERHKLTYDAFSQNLEPVYFWILDFVQGVYGKVDKLVDNFVSSAGSGFFAEMQGRATRMQEEGMKMMQTAGVLTKSIIQLIYDLKEFKMRLKQYEELRSKDPRIKNAANLSLKQIWMDNVDMKRGNSSIKGLAQNFDYVTLIDAFMSANSLKQVDGLDLNDRVKRIIQQRYKEYERWLVESERELSKRFEIERTYLRSQVNSLNLYTRWAKPYFKAAKMLEQNSEYDANLVNAFNTSVFELTLLAQGRYDPQKDIDAGNLPKGVNKGVRKYTDCALIEFRFRSIPDRSDQKGGYTFRGKVDVEFTGFALNEDELAILKKEVGKDDFNDVFGMIDGATTDSLAQLREDIEEFLNDASEIKWNDYQKEEKKKDENDVNPFAALFAFTEKKDEVKAPDDGIKKDSFWEEVIRGQAILAARASCRKLYDTYKKAHGMLAFPPTLSL